MTARRRSATSRGMARTTREPAAKREAKPAAPSPRVVRQKYALVPVDDLVPKEKNPRRGNVAVIGESVDANGFYGAVIAQKSSGRILVGNHRYRAAVERGARKIPVIFIDVDDAAAEKISLVDNRTSDIAGYDDEALAAALREIGDSDALLAGTGYSAGDLAVLLKRVSPESPAAFPEIDEHVTVTKKCPKCGFCWS